MTEEDLRNLRILAGKATPGRWAVSGVRSKIGNMDWHTINGYDPEAKQDKYVASVAFDPRNGEGFSDARYIAAASPSTVLFLLDQISQLRDALQRHQDRGCPDCGGDCSSANPPVSCCIMIETRDALKGASCRKI